MKNEFFVLYQDCQIVKGYKNIVLFDLYRKTAINITDFYHVFIDEKYIKNNEDNCHLISLLLEKEYGYIGGKTKDNKKTIWFSANPINELIIDFSLQLSSPIKFICDKIEEIGSEYLQIRFVDYDFISLKKFVDFLSDSCVRTIEIVFPFSHELSKNDKIINFLINNPRIQVIYFYNAPFNKALKMSSLFTIIYYNKNLIDSHNCGIVSSDYFIIDIKNFSKSKLYNNCLKDKLFIDVNGEIKNCPAFSESLMNIQKLSINLLSNKIINNKIRNITKDSISICKDCEYRYVCIDCRAHREDENNILSKPIKCNYDPYTGHWNN